MKTIKIHALLLVMVLAVALTLNVQTANSAATIVISNNDGPGEGFNDPGAPVVAPGNPGGTLGAQRLFAFQYAANLIGQCLNSNVVITVQAQMDPQFCSAGSAVLGSAGATTVHRDFAGALVAGTWYPQALANALAGVDLAGGTPDINATFNSNLNGNPACLGGIGWYYGTDQNPGSDIDFITVVLHEIMHGLGFQTFVSLGSGAKFLGFNDTYMLNLACNGAVPSDYPSMSDAQRVACSQNDPLLVWTGACVTADYPLIPLVGGTNGGLVRMHGPSPQQPGSSVSHWSTALTPSEVEEPFYVGANHSPGLALSLYKDIGWTLDPKTPIAVAITRFEVAATDGGVEVLAEFASSYDAVSVNVYRASGAEGDNFRILEAVANDGVGDFVYYDNTPVPGETYRYKIGVTDLDGEFFSPAAKITLPLTVTELRQNVPNPFNPTTSISFKLPAQETVTLTIYDASGRLVKTLVNGVRGNGTHNIEWNGTNDAGNAVGSGIYFYRLTAGKFTQSKKMVMLK